MGQESMKHQHVSQKVMGEVTKEQVGAVGDFPVSSIGHLWQLRNLSNSKQCVVSPLSVTANTISHPDSHVVTLGQGEKDSPRRVGLQVPIGHSISTEGRSSLPPLHSLPPAPLKALPAVITPLPAGLPLYLAPL